MQNTVQATLELEKYKLHIKERELELKFQGEREELQLKYQGEREEREFKLRELELQNARLQAERSPRQSVSTDPFFNVSRNIRLVPNFNERDVEQFVLHFEKVATNLKWHKDMWSVLVQSVQVGKAQEV